MAHLVRSHSSYIKTTRFRGHVDLPASTASRQGVHDRGLNRRLSHRAHLILDLESITLEKGIACSSNIAMENHQVNRPEMVIAAIAAIAILVCQRMPEGINSKCHNKVSEILSLFSAWHRTCSGKRSQYFLGTSPPAAFWPPPRFLRSSGEQNNSRGCLEAGSWGLVLSSYHVNRCESWGAISAYFSYIHYIHVFITCKPDRTYVFSAKTNSIPHPM